LNYCFCRYQYRVCTTSNGPSIQCSLRTDEEVKEIIKKEESRRSGNDTINVESYKGFRLVIDAIHDSQKPVIVHNGFLGKVIIKNMFIVEFMDRGNVLNI